MSVSVCRYLKCRWCRSLRLHDGPVSGFCPSRLMCLVCRRWSSETRKIRLTRKQSGTSWRRSSIPSSWTWSTPSRRVENSTSSLSISAVRVHFLALPGSAVNENPASEGNSLVVTGGSYKWSMSRSRIHRRAMPLFFLDPNATGTGSFWVLCHS